MIGESNSNRINFPNYGIQKWSNGGLSGTQSKSITITSHGRPIFLLATGDNNAGSGWMRIRLFRDGNALTWQICEGTSSSQNVPFSLSWLDIVPAGTYTYRCDLSLGGGSVGLGEEGALQAPQFIVFEI